MKTYQTFLETILKEGTVKTDRTGTGTISIFGYQMRFDLNKGFPLVTTKKMATKAIISELLWFLEGSEDERRLAEIHFGDKAENLIGKKTIWTANADAQGKALGYTNTDTVKLLGPVYGVQWRKMKTLVKNNGVVEEKVIDQIADLIQQVKKSPDSRRMLVSAWNVAEIPNMALPPCHATFQLYVADNKLSCQLYQRSADAFLGVPFNIASYALLTMMIAQICDLELGDFVHTFGDAHIYLNHKEQVELQLSRTPHELPTMKINPLIKDINDFKMSDFELINYTSHETIKADMAV